MNAIARVNDRLNKAAEYLIKLMMRGEIGRGALWRGLETLGSEGLSFAAFSVLAHFLAPADFGAIALVVSVMILMQVALQHGLSEALIQRSKISSLHWRTAGSANFAVALVLIIVGLLIAWILPLALDRASLRWLLVALLPSLLLRAASMIMVASNRRDMNFKSIAIRTLLGVLAGAIVGIWLAHVGFGVWALVAQQWAGEIVGFVCLLISARHKPWHIGGNKHALRDLLPVALPVLSAQFLTNAARRLDMLALGFFLSDRDLGIYFLVNRLVLSAQLVTQHAIADVALTPLSRLAADPAAFKRGAIRLLRLGLLISCAGLGLLSVLGPALIPFAFGHAWISAATPLRWLAAMSSAGAVTAFCGVALVAIGRARSFARLSIMLTLLQIGGAALSAKWGLQSVIYAVGGIQIAIAIPAICILSAETNTPQAQVWNAVWAVLLVAFLGFTAAIIISNHGGLYEQFLAGALYTSVIVTFAAYQIRTRKIDKIDAAPA